MTFPRRFVPFFAVLLLPLFSAAGTPSPLAARIAAIEAAQAAELARLEAALAAGPAQAEALALQRCAAYVKLASVLALYEAQLAQSETAGKDAGGAGAREALAGLVEQWRARVAAQSELLPPGYAFVPLAAPDEEVRPCAE